MTTAHQSFSRENRVHEKSSSTHSSTQTAQEVFFDKTITLQYKAEAFVCTSHFDVQNTKKTRTGGQGPLNQSSIPTHRGHLLWMQGDEEHDSHLCHQVKAPTD